MSRYDLRRDDLAALMADEPAYRVNQVFDGLYRRCVEPAGLSELPRALRERLEAAPALAPAFHCVAESVADRGTTLKWLLETNDAERIETVLMRYRDRTTVCVSSQAGCAMGCSFCATGDAGFSRQLSSGEIVEQVVLASRRCRSEGWGQLGNVVLMGMGEPLANFEAVWSAVVVMNRDLGLGARHITISTVGVVPGINRLAAERLQVNLAVSLHAANDSLRDRLVPLNRRYPLAMVTEACARYRAATGRRISFEWACMEDVNDHPSDAQELAALARPLGAHVNLIPLNPTPGGLFRGLKGSSRTRVLALQAWLIESGVNATIRQNRGRSIDAACGQLAAGGARPVPRRAAPAPKGAWSAEESG
ncbi:MAG: 23S rRNA (adenine(2503)-C(2))-methyltransferase RlmN [Acidimicrobiales bacterium]